MCFGFWVLFIFLVGFEGGRVGDHGFCLALEVLIIWVFCLVGGKNVKESGFRMFEQVILLNSFVFIMEQEGGEVHEFIDLDIAIEW